MTSTTPASAPTRKERPTGSRDETPRKAKTQLQQQPAAHGHIPAAGAHAAAHLINEDATPGAGVLPSHAHASGKEVDGGAG